MKRLLNIITAISFCVTTSGTALNPVANPEAVVTEGVVRFTVLTPEMIRVEYSPSEQFEDRATFTAIFRCHTSQNRRTMNFCISTPTN